MGMRGHGNLFEPIARSRNTVLFDRVRPTGLRSSEALMTTPTIDFARLDLRSAFDFAILIEEDAQLRYEQLSRLLGDDPGGAGDVFRAMVVNEGRHRSELVARRDALFRDAPARIAISVVGDGPERPDVEDDELPRTAREALEVSLAGERRAHDFFERALPSIRDPEVHAFFEQLMREEVEHGAALEEKLAALGLPTARDLDARPRPAASSASRPETYPDRADLEAVLPHFDAATQAVVGAVIVAGIEQREVAAALGISRATVARMLTRFLTLARQHAAVALAAATLAGCAGGLRQAEPSARAGQEAPRSGAHWAERDGRHPKDRELREAGHDPRIQAEVAARMPDEPPAVHGRLARAIVLEAARAGVDPLLVLALIHVESSFDPEVVSSAGAVGLMQLREPTMRREVERSGLRMTDPHDPVLNVQAGVRYLQRLIAAFGDVDVALMAYNAGPNRIRGHLRQGEIPERFHHYPRKVRAELRRLQLATRKPTPGLTVRWARSVGTEHG